MSKTCDGCQHACRDCGRYGLSTHISSGLERRKGGIGTEASVHGRSAIHIGGVVPCKLEVGDLDSRGHRLHLLHILGGEHCAIGRCLHGKLHQMRLPVEDLAWHLLDWVWNCNVLLSQDRRDGTGQARCWILIDTNRWLGR